MSVATLSRSVEQIPELGNVIDFKELLAERRRRCVVYLGELAINRSELETDDPITHLFIYLDCDNSEKEAVLSRINRDAITDIAERLPRASFRNRVNFNHIDGDFLSLKDRISMRDMTDMNLEIWTRKANANPRLRREKNRAELEVEEIKVLDDWFNGAGVDSCLVFESLPIGMQTMAVTRIYQKVSDNELIGHFISLHNSDIESFNSLRSHFGAFDQCKVEEDFLSNYYKFDATIESYIETYDTILSDKRGDKYHFGMPEEEFNDGLAKVNNNQNLVAPYTDLIQLLGNSGGRVNDQLIDFCQELKLLKEGETLKKYQVITTDMARKLLKETINSIVSAFNKNDDKALAKIIKDGNSRGVVADFGSDARANGIVYHSNNCPESGLESVASQGLKSESEIITENYNLLNGLPKNFGEAHQGYCRVKGCPNHDKIGKVGGCEVCLCCHNMYEDHKDPIKFYADKKAAEDKNNKELLAKKAKLKQAEEVKKKAKQKKKDNELKKKAKDLDKKNKLEVETLAKSKIIKINKKMIDLDLKIAA